MRRHLLTLILALFYTIGYAQTIPAPARKAPAKKTATKPAPKVNLCEGGSAYAYHSSSSRSGFNRCTHTVSSVTRADAEGNYGRRLQEVLLGFVGYFLEKWSKKSKL